MSKSQSAHSKAKSFVENLQELVSVLPTETEKEEIRGNLDAVIRFFSEIRQTLDLLPSSEESGNVQQATNKLGELIQKVEGDSKLAAIFGLRRASSPSTSRSAEPTPVDVAEAKSELPHLQSLPVDEIRVRLIKASYSLSRLRAIAAELGIKTDKRISKEALVHQISMSIANYRGYRQLSGHPDETRTAVVAEDPGEART